VTADRYTLYATSDGARVECLDCDWTQQTDGFTDADDDGFAILETLTVAHQEHATTHRTGA